MEKKHDYPNLKKASVILDEATLTAPQQYGYDLYLDNIRTWNATMVESFDEGFEEGMEKGVEKGMEKGSDLTVAILSELRRSKKTIEQIAQEFNVKIEFVQKLHDLL
jgi:predicted transposase YdaD